MTIDWRALSARLAWRIVRWLHRVDFACVVPLLARLPIPLGQRLALWRGRLNGATGRDWRSVALGFRHVRAQSALGYRHLAPAASETTVRQWVHERFVAEARDEYEARLVAAHRVDGLEVALAPPDALQRLKQRERGLVLLTPHYQSFFIGVAFLARSGARVNGMSSAVTQDPRVDPAVQRHFDAKYRGLERYMNGGRVIDFETGTRQFYQMLNDKEIVVILADAPPLPGGATMQVEFLGGRREVAGGPLRMAQRTDSDIGCFVCRHVAGARYHLELGPMGRGDDPGTWSNAYRFLSDAITRDPGGWWAADLLPSMRLHPEDADGGARAA